jgi:hypothetical protein
MSAGTTKRLPKHVKRHGNKTLYFYLTVPPSIRKAFGKASVSQRLNTKSPKEAGTMAAELASKWNRVFREDYGLLKDINGKRRDGFVYGIVNPAYPGWVKLGSATDMKARLRQYQTADPFRSFTTAFVISTPYPRLIEDAAGDKLKDMGITFNNEWFETNPTTVKRIVAEATVLHDDKGD